MSHAREKEAGAASAGDSGILLRVAWQHKGLLALGIVVGLAIGGGIVALLPRVYQSTAQVLVMKKRPDAVTGMDTRQGPDEYVTPAQELLKSSLIIDRAIRAKNLDSLLADEDDPSEAIRRGLNVLPVKAPVGQTNVFRLTYRGKNHEDCPVVLTAIIDSFKDFIDKKHQTGSTDTIELILREKQVLERELVEKETAYRQFREKSPLLSKGRDGLDLRQERLNIIQAKRSALLLRRVEIDSQLAAVAAALKKDAGRQAVLIMLVDYSSKSDTGEPGREKHLNLQEQLFPLLIEERKLLDLYGPKHSEVVAIRARIEAARRLLVLPPAAWARADSKRQNPSTDPIDLHLEVLKQKSQHIKVSEELLAKVFEAENEEARRLATFEIQDESFRTSIALSKQMYETLVKRLGDASLIRNVGGYEVDTIDAPSVARKAAPNLRLFLILGGVLGGLVGLSMAYGADGSQANRAGNVPKMMSDGAANGTAGMTVASSSGSDA